MAEPVVHGSSANESPFPSGNSIAFVGDGGFSVLMAEFAAAVRYQLPIKVIIIIKNNVLGQIKWEQMVFLGNPEYGCELHQSTLRHLLKPAGEPVSPLKRRADAAVS